RRRRRPGGLRRRRVGPARRRRGVRLRRPLPRLHLKPLHLKPLHLAVGSRLSATTPAPMPNSARILNALPTHAPFQRAVEVIFALAQGRWYRRHPSSGAVTPISTPRLVVQITRTGATPSTADYDVTVLEDGLGVTVGAQATRSTT